MTFMAEPPPAYHPPNHFILQIDHVSEATRTPGFHASKELPSGSSTPGDGWRSTNVQTPNGSQINLVPQPLDKEQPPLDENPEISNFKNTARSNFSVSTVVPEQVHYEPPYNVFSPRKRKAMMYLCAIAGMFSSLSANVYFPALGQISRQFNISLSQLSLTITIYMIFQALAPSFWGPLSDARGRRVTFISTFVVYLIANVCLAFSNNFALLMIFRGMQATGSAATISIGQGVIADIASPKERGSFTGTNQGIRMFGQAIGPVLGGIIAQYLGFHGIFWVLFGGGAFALIILIVFLPETLHPIAGNGSLRLTGIHRPLYYKFSPFPSELVEHNLPPKPKITPSMIFHPLKLLFHKDVFSVIFFGSIVYTVWSMMTSSTTALFQTRFGLDDLTLGLIFLPNGIASMVGAYVTGKLSKRDWRIMEQQYRAENKIPGSVPLNKKHLADFPFEKARMRNIWWMVAIFIITTALYGFSLQFDILALPLILQFCVSFTANSIFTLNSTLVVDLFPGQSASATALNNLVRCLLGAGGVAVVQKVIDGIGGGRAFVLFAGITLLVCPLVVVEWKYGGKWAGERRERLTAEKKLRDVERETGEEKK